MVGVASSKKLSVLSLLLALAACGGGGGGGGDTPVTPPGNPTPGAYADTAVYSSAATASLPSAVEAVATTQHSITLNGTAIPYTAKAGHLTARAPGTNADEASFFYVAYTADNQAAATRPVTFFYNGGPGSASVWLHLGSFGPKRLATGVPATTATAPFPLVDNAESLLDVSDLVFVNAVGSGLSQAIAPNTNRTFWGVDTDAAVFRDFVQRYIALNAREASPKYLFGESYGGPRTGVLASLLETAGVKLTGLVLQSPAMDYNSNCGVTGVTTISCADYLPSFAAIGMFHQLSQPLPTDLPGFMTQVRGFTADRFAPAITSVLAGGSVPADLPPLLQGYTGLAAFRWQTNLNLQPGSFQNGLLAGNIIGRYDGRMKAALDSPLAREGDPSSTFLTPSFATGISAYLGNTLLYTNASTYVLLSNAIESWNFSHAGKQVPDTIPDLGAALALNPQLRVLAVNGYHDIATPFRQTEQDLARLNLGARILVRNYAGGHMTYLDDVSRPQMKADLAAFYRGTLTATSSSANGAAAPTARAQAVTLPSASAESFTPPGTILTTARDPWVPATRRPTLATPPSQGMALQAEIESRLRAQFAAASGGAESLTKAQAQQAGLGAVAAQFDQIDTTRTGRVSFEDWRRHLRAQASR